MSPIKLSNIKLSVTLFIFFNVAFNYFKIQNQRSNLSDQNHENKTNASSKIIYIYLWTQIRSGSQLTGKLLSVNFDTFYIEEPVVELMLSQTKDNTQISPFLFDILNCEFNKYPKYQQRLSLLTYSHAKDVFKMKLENLLDQEWIIGLLSSFCRSSKYRLARIVYPSLEATAEIVRHNKYNVKVIFLTRDPRAVINSRSYLYSIINMSQVYNEHPCDKLETDIQAYIKLKMIYPHK